MSSKKYSEAAAYYDGFILLLAEIGLLPPPKKGPLSASFTIDAETGFSYLISGDPGLPTDFPLKAGRPVYARGKVTAAGLSFTRASDPPKELFWEWAELARLIKNFYPVVSGGRNPREFTHEEVAEGSLLLLWLRREYDILDEEGRDWLAGIAIHAMTCARCRDNELCFWLVKAAPALVDK